MFAVMVIVVCHAIAAISIFYDHEEDHKYHHYQGNQGLFICFLRFILFIGFFFGIYSTYSKVNTQPANSPVKKFLLILTIIGTVFLLSLPLLIFWVSYFTESLDQQ